MIRVTQYYTLIGSLPALPPHFEQAERVPISWPQLSERLKMLQPRDAEVLDELSDFLTWERQPLERTDQQVVDRFNHFAELVENRFARQLLRQNGVVIPPPVKDLDESHATFDHPPSKQAVTGKGPVLVNFWSV